MSAYELKAGMVSLQDKKLCDPCLSALRWFVYHTSAVLFLLDEDEDEDNGVAAAADGDDDFAM